MKIVKLTLAISWLFLITGLLTSAFGQETEKKVHIKVIKNGETTVDTSFSAGDMNKDQLHKKIETITGENIDINSDHAEKHTKDHSNVWVDTGEGHHEMKKVIISEEEGNTGESSERKEVQYVVIKKGEGYPDKDIDIQAGDDTLHVNGENVFVIHTDEKGDVHWTEDLKDQKNEKKIIVKVLSDKEDVNENNPQKNVKVIILDDKDGTIFVNDNVKVIKTNKKDNEVEVIIETGKTKTSKETKQKKSSKRNKK